MKRAASRIPTSASKYKAGQPLPALPKPTSEVLDELRALVDPERKRGHEVYFKGTIDSLGIPMAQVLMVARQYGKALRKTDKETVFAACESLFRSGGFEASIIACHWSRIPRRQYTATDIGLFGRWLNNYVGNWATCDTFCNHSIAMVLERYPQTVDTLFDWAKSENRWVRRGAAVSLVVPAKKGLFIETVLGIAKAMLRDSDDMVQKGYGWMLKEAYAAQPDVLEDFILRHAGAMPRTAFRYAIEKWPAAKRKKAMDI